MEAVTFEAFDAVAHGVEVVALVGGTWRILRIAVVVRDGVRDSLRDFGHAIGSRHPPEGLMGDVEGLKKETLKHRERLIRLEVNGGLKIEDRS